MVEEATEARKGGSNMLIVASTPHFPLFEKASEDWMGLIAAMREEIGKLSSNQPIPNVPSANNETLAHHFTQLLKHIPTSIHLTLLPSFKRVLLQFEDLIYLDVILNWLKQFGVKCWKGWKHISLPSDNLSAAPVKDLGPERFIHSSSETEVLKPPNKPIQMQSPPPSPYIGWIQREEDAPDEISVIDPRALKSVLFDDCGVPVFNDNDIMDELDLGEAESEEQQPEEEETQIIILKVPNIIVDTVEAESLRQIAKEYETNNQ